MLTQKVNKNYYNSCIKTITTFTRDNKIKHSCKRKKTAFWSIGGAKQYTRHTGNTFWVSQFPDSIEYANLRRKIPQKLTKNMKCESHDTTNTETRHYMCYEKLRQTHAQVTRNKCWHESGLLSMRIWDARQLPDQRLQNQKNYSQSRHDSLNHLFCMVQTLSTRQKKFWNM